MITERVVSIPNVHLAILGGGGQGKTSVALHVIHHPRVVETFLDDRVWVPCAEATTVSLFLELLATSLGIPKSARDRRAEIMQALRSGGRRRALVLDNFETPWDIDGHQSEVEDIISGMASIQDVSIIITMRAYIPPTATSRMTWTPPTLQPLSVLHKQAARQLYIALDPVAENDPALDALLSALDYVPLAVTLMARVGLYGETPSMLLKRWNDSLDSTEVLNLGTDQLSSVKVSIEMSVNSNIIKANPDALHLLSILSMLPAGARRDSIAALAPGIASARAIVNLLQATLITLENPRQIVRVLAPIRLYMQQHHPPTPEARLSLHSFYYTLLDTYYSMPGETLWVETLARIGPEEANIETILLDGMNHPDASEERTRAIEAALRFARYQQFTTPRLEIVRAAANCSRAIQNRDLLGRSLYRLGDMLRVLRQYVEATAALEEAREAFRMANDLQGTTVCSFNLGRTLEMMDQNDAAETVLRETRVSFQKLGDSIQAGDCLYSISKTFRNRSRFQEQETTLREALTEYERLGDAFRVAHCLRSIGDSFKGRRMYDEGELHLEKAKESFQKLGDNVGQAECLQSLGDIMRLRGQYEQAESTLKGARETFLKNGDILRQAESLLSLSMTFAALDRFQEADAALNGARESFDRINSVEGKAKCLASSGNMLLKQGAVEKAEVVLKEARVSFESINNTRGAADCLRDLAKLYYTRNQLKEAEEAIKEAQRSYDQLGLAVDAENCRTLLEEDRAQTLAR